MLDGNHLGNSKERVAHTHFRSYGEGSAGGVLLPGNWGRALEEGARRLVSLDSEARLQEARLLALPKVLLPER